MTQPGEGEEDLDLKAIGDEIDGSDPAAEEVQEDAADPAADEQTQEEVQQPEAEQEKVVEASEVEIAGRKYKSQADANRAHDHLYRHASKLEQELKATRQENKQFGELKALWREHPDLFTALKKAEADYFAARKAGATPGQAKAISRTQSVPPEIMNQLKELREWKARQEQVSQKQEYAAEEARLKNEFDQLTAKHKLDEAGVDKVRSVMLEYAEKRGIELSAEDALELVQLRENRAAKTELQRVKAHADTGTTSSGTPKPAGKNAADMDDREFDAALNDFAKSQGLTD